jgi:hypothetical protein
VCRAPGPQLGGVDIFGRSRASPDEAAEKQAELASIAEQKRQQEAA